MTPRTPATAWLTPPAIAEEMGLRQSKVAGWIRSGELVAVNVAEHTGGRPRWRIRRADLEAFLLRRQSQKPAEPIRRRRRQDQDVIKFF
jgi:excisionase family DNA binding protein